VFKASICVTLRQGILDPAGQAVKSGLHSQGFGAVEQVRMGKFMELILNTHSENEASDLVRAMCAQLLANPVMEEYTFTLETLV